MLATLALGTSATVDRPVGRPVGRKLLLYGFCGVMLVLAGLLAPIPDRQTLAQAPQAPVVLVLVGDGLTWRSAESSGLAPVFRDGAVATLSTAQGQAPEDPRMAYVLLGAGARADTSLLPDELPKDRAGIPNFFDGPAATIHPGSLGDAVAKANLQTAAVGERAALVVMDSKGDVSKTYEEGTPEQNLEKALWEGLDLIAVQASTSLETAAAIRTAQGRGATVAVTAPNAPADAANLTPFGLSGPDGVLYSPGTRTTGLLSSEDVAPTLLDRLGVEAPPQMAGRPAEVQPGNPKSPAGLQEHLAFVDEERSTVWTLLVGVAAAAFAFGAYLRGREGLRLATLFLVALPFGALVAAALPVANAVSVAGLAALAAGGLAAVAGKVSTEGLSSLAVVSLATVGFVALDAAFGGRVMSFSVLGHDPAYGTRFYGIGNEYSAVVAGALPLGMGLLVGWRTGLSGFAAVVGAVVVVALGLPVMGADVGGSLALGIGFGAMVGFMRGGRFVGLALGAGVGSLFAVALFVVGGALFSDVSHGARAASGDLALYEVALRKIILSLRHLLNPLWTVLLVVLAALAFFGWRRAEGKGAVAGIVGAVISAVASGALNDSGILATILALAYPAAAGAMLLMRSPDPSGSDI